MDFADILQSMKTEKCQIPQKTWRPASRVRNCYIEVNWGKLFKVSSPEAGELDEEEDEREEELLAEEIDTM